MKFFKKDWIQESDLTNRKDLLKYWINPYDKKKVNQDSYLLESDKNERMDIVGESFYQKTFIKLFGKHTEDGCREYTTAILFPQPNNEHDEYAVGVYLINGQVGHLSRQDAYLIQEVLIRTMHQTQQLITIKAQAKGGWKRGVLGRDKGDFGLELCIGKHELIQELENIKNDPKEQYKPQK